MPSKTNFKDLIQFYLSVKYLPARQVIAKQIIESVDEIIQKTKDTSILDLFSNNIRRYSGDLSIIERELLKSEITLMANMIDKF